MWVVTLHSLFLYSEPPLPCHPSSYWLRLFLSQTFSPLNDPTFLKPSHSSHLPANEDGTDTVCSEMSAYRIQMPENYPEESIYQVTCMLSFNGMRLKVKQSCCRPRMAQISWHRHRMVVRLSALCTGRLNPQEMLLVLIYVRGWVDLRAIVRSEGLCQWKIPMTPAGIESATFWFVAQYHNHCATAVPPLICVYV